MARIKAALDPYGACDPFFYAEPLRQDERGAEGNPAAPGAARR
jgi:hypothetical protein